jgi:type II secretory pathway pseudopilin PulG
MDGLVRVRRSEGFSRGDLATRNAGRRGRHRGPGLVETLVGAQVVAIVVALVFFTFGMSAERSRAACRSEVTAVRSALTTYRLQYGKASPNLYSLVAINMLKAVPGPNAASTTAGFSYDPVTGTYAGGTCR